MKTASNVAVTHREHKLMIDFAMKWLHFGGGSASDIFVEFGVSERVFFERLAGCIDHADWLSSATRSEITDLCARRR